VARIISGRTDKFGAAAPLIHMSMWRRMVTVSVFVVGASALVGGCGSDDEGNGGAAGSGARGNEQAGQTCKSPADCYPNVADAGALKGEIDCLDRVPNGYCTHRCETDADCCAVEGECRTGLKQVCAPLESTGLKQCFVSCEDADLLDENGNPVVDGGIDATAFCHRYASPELGCRSTGGGAENRKVCLP
jgi:hypothetical protein